VVCEHKLHNNMVLNASSTFYVLLHVCVALSVIYLQTIWYFKEYHNMMLCKVHYMLLHYCLFVPLVCALFENV